MGFQEPRFLWGRLDCLGCCRTVALSNGDDCLKRIPLLGSGKMGIETELGVDKNLLWRELELAKKIWVGKRNFKRSYVCKMRAIISIASVKSTDSAIYA